MYVRTPENEADLVTVYAANLRSPDSEGRAASLFGLGTLKHSSTREFALASLRDDTDLVLMTACTILLPAAQRDPNLRTILQDVYRAYKGKADFQMSMSLLEAHSLGDDGDNNAKPRV